RVVMVGDLFRQRIGVVHPNGFEVERRAITDAPRDDGAKRWRIAVLEIVGAVHRRQHGDVDGKPLALPEDPVLAEELDRPIARAMDADLSIGHDPESVLEADLRAGVDAEQIGGEVAEVPLTERAGEAVGYARGALEFRQP